MSATEKEEGNTGGLASREEDAQERGPGGASKMLLIGQVGRRRLRGRGQQVHAVQFLCDTP